MTIRQLLHQSEEQSRTNREKGANFEHITKIFLENDKTYSPQFQKIQIFSEWAKEYGEKRHDTGIDLVATNNDNSFTAIQCKFYSKDSKISKKDIDSFIAASIGEQFTRRIFVDTTDEGITDKVRSQIELAKGTDFTRIGLDTLERSSINWDKYLKKETLEQNPKKQLKPHQQEAIEAISKGLEVADRGKLIMACGTGKTFTALKIAEKLAGENKNVLVLTPSLALVSQTITEWTIESNIDLNAFAVCSDTQIGKRKVQQADIAEIDTYDLAYPATTDAQKLAQKYHLDSHGKMNVVFATYQSIEVISKAQKEYDLPEFDLIICDEAHRTTGASLAGQDESHFVKIHNQDFLQGKKRLYMTATPRVFITQVKKKADIKGAIVYSMDDEEKFGKELYLLNFDEAVQRQLLSDYKVLVFGVDEEQIAKDIQTRIAESDKSLKLDDASKMVGCYKALLKIGIEDTEGSQPMRRAVSFCRGIKDSKLFRDEFEFVIEEGYRKNQDEYTDDQLLQCEIRHLDGTMNTAIRDRDISWLKKEHNDKICRILTNARCLSEGVDVPSLDAVLFVHSRKSKVDIVQSVGRVMRKAEGKKLGYVILPIIISAGVKPEEALNNNKNYEIVWDVLNALRSHDERLDSEINRIEFGGLTSRIEVISEVKDLPHKAAIRPGPELGGGGKRDSDTVPLPPEQLEINHHYDSVQRAILAKIVDKCGTRTYWETWANDVAEIAQKHITRINGILADKNSQGYRAFVNFLAELQKNINTSITADEVVEMLAQHMITMPVFEALFADYDFNANNPVSQAIQKVLDVLEKNNIDSEAKKLERFYATIKTRVAGVDNELGKQKIIIELYDKFFRTAFPKLTERLGIVYTPVECVDFIIHSINDVLINEFNQTLGDENTHIIDPFTGTGTFITRLLQSGLIDQEQLQHKYKKELHANEIILLAYYIATINIESTYHALINSQQAAKQQAATLESDKVPLAAEPNADYQVIPYQPFEGICLTDTFQLYEQTEDLLTPQLPVNSTRLNKQKKLDIKVIIGNPPYSAGQRSANDNNQNLKYPKLDKNINKTYVKTSLHKGNKNALYDSYIRAIRWASDRIGTNGVIGFITNAGWIESNSADGMRKILTEEFSKLYIFHLRGNQRTSGDLSRKEGGKIFGGGSRAPIAISILVKNSQSKSRGKIYFHNISDYLNREQKLKIIRDLGSINSITQQNYWQIIQPDKYNDWLNQRNDSFYGYIPLGDKKDKANSTVKIFENYSRGLGTSRDAWVYNASRSKLEKNIKRTIAFYNQECKRYQQSDKKTPVKDFVADDSSKITWNDSMFNAIKKNQIRRLNSEKHIPALYRPFNQINCYYNREWNEGIYQMPKIFPEAELDNLVIGVSGKGANSFSCLISDNLIDLNLLEAGTQCFPLVLYEPVKTDNHTDNGLFTSNAEVITAPSGKQYIVRDAITDEGLTHFTDFYQADLSKEDVFYYLYGLLHAEDYRTRFADNLTRDLPHIPRVKTLEDFLLFNKAGRDLADLHLNYEDKVPYEVTFEQGKIAITEMKNEDFYVDKMRFGKNDKSTIIYNHNITITNIPLEAYQYVVNGRSAIEWVMERQRISIHKDSGIINNPNDWANETMNNPRYPLDLLLKVITISLDSIKIIKSLPKLDF